MKQGVSPAVVAIVIIVVLAIAALVSWWVFTKKPGEAAGQRMSPEQLQQKMQQQGAPMSPDAKAPGASQEPGG